ncbi:uncharacterized protein ASCRUDRAFT_101766 [Ascoidea rubescens DSM 1968]|uniref:Uncharacterized protein n=1 Tax=Ascoidea rubescens DSM 1968 TaxID=1344418 RepID=A0A1D2VR69_9ASCO|nr:hypothetical protein ASCRUDRAFT_101766 [Ascoidea rubescens DSM 1968]ODV64057.1 hypothetical protein ASCRUDRAFT_101766 [Ascoidea rubescens DSM 1968]
MVDFIDPIIIALVTGLKGALRSLPVVCIQSFGVCYQSAPVRLCDRTQCFMKRAGNLFYGLLSYLFFDLNILSLTRYNNSCQLFLSGIGLDHRASWEQISERHRETECRHPGGSQSLE